MATKSHQNQNYNRRAVTEMPDNGDAAAYDINNHPDG